MDENGVSDDVARMRDMETRNDVCAPGSRVIVDILKRREAQDQGDHKPVSRPETIRNERGIMVRNRKRGNKLGQQAEAGLTWTDYLLERTTKLIENTVNEFDSHNWSHLQATFVKRYPLTVGGKGAGRGSGVTRTKLDALKGAGVAVMDFAKLGQAMLPHMHPCSGAAHIYSGVGLALRDMKAGQKDIVKARRTRNQRVALEPAKKLSNQGDAATKSSDKSEIRRREAWKAIQTQSMAAKAPLPFSYVVLHPTEFGQAVENVFDVAQLLANIDKPGANGNRVGQNIYHMSLRIYKSEEHHRRWYRAHGLPEPGPGQQYDTLWLVTRELDEQVLVPEMKRERGVEANAKIERCQHYEWMEAKLKGSVSSFIQEPFLWQYAIKKFNVQECLLMRE
ncbi:hypothetical protein KIPB_005920 [Kipferlia bialata]|uniref:Uncharacterized protein n=1 Tax=Kipferlia bialata TaxID=797122 RepID=A0A9K3GIP3_9EUKA|nr:hypothetical protein KIPB_005920 [Kipferlia bialata]|eukprot:g5920.t1